MKQIPLLQGRALLVELPEKHEAAFKALLNGRELTINRKNKSANVDHIVFDFEFAEQLFNHGLLECTSGNLDTKDRHYLFGLGWRIIGMLSEMTESEAAQIVKLHATIKKYRDYLIDNDRPTDMFTKTALESLDSAIVAEGYAFQSAPKPENKDFFWGYLDDLAKWETAQSRVLSRERCLLLGREG